MVFDRQDASKQTRTFSRRFDVNEYLSQRLGEPFREYRRLLEKAVQFEVELPFPIHVDFEIAFLCNLACVMCTHAADAPVHIKPKRPNFMDFNVYKKVVDEGVAQTLRSVGLDQEGEAFLVKRLPDFIEYARSKGIVDVFFNTNATLMTKEKADMILNSGLTRIHFSLDAMTENTYKKVRIGGHFEGGHAKHPLFPREKKRAQKGASRDQGQFCQDEVERTRVREFCSILARQGGLYCRSRV
jgi:sulfatase maturation enzyme AslB (radical SAM superfamily)